MGTYTKWTESERDAARAAVVAGKPPREVLHLFPGRTDQHVRNMMAVARRSMLGLCNCGGPMPADPSYTNRTCLKCAAKAHKSHVRLRKEGTCIRCWKRPADGTLTWCATCTEKRRAEERARRPEPDPAKDCSWTGVLRWKSAGRMQHFTPLIPKDARTVVDLFGGSASLAAQARSDGFARVVYNDVHPTLCDLVEEVKSGQAMALLAAAATFERMTPDELLRAYDSSASEPRVVRAALLLLVAHSVGGRNMHRREVTSVCPLRPSYLARAGQLASLLADVEVSNRDFVDALEEHDDPDTVFFVDPPFPGTEYYEHNLSNDRFEELVGALSRVRGRFILVSGSTRFAAERLRVLPYLWLKPTHHGKTAHRLLVASNYELPLVRVKPEEFGMAT